jgi:DNA-binding Xre family transcriptional regulator
VKGKNMIRIPEKLCKSLEISKGDLVKVSPAV